LSKNKAFTIDDIINNPDIPWDYGGVSENPNVNWSVVVNHPDLPWDYPSLARNPNITADIVSDNPNYPWGDKCVHKLPHWREWNDTTNVEPYMGVTRGASASELNEMIDRFTFHAQDVTYLRTNGNLNWEMAKRLRLNWERDCILLNPGINPAEVLNDFSNATPEDSDWVDAYSSYICVLSANPNTDLQFILDEPRIQDWTCASLNPNLTWKDIVNTDVPWTFSNLSSNKFNRQNAAITLQRYWRKRKRNQLWDTWNTGGSLISDLPSELVHVISTYL
jgi:hypothetical protein